MKSRDFYAVRQTTVFLCEFALLMSCSKRMHTSLIE